MSDEYRTLKEIQEEIAPEGEAVDKDEILDTPLIVQRIKPFTGKFGPSVRVYAVRQDTGELVHFTGGQPMRDALADVAEYLPFVATLTKGETSAGREFYKLE